MLRLWLFLLFLGLFVSGTLGGCFIAPLQHSMVGGNDIFHCFFKGENFWLGEEKKVSAPECLRCTCSENGLSCCGYGSALLGVMGVPGNSKCVPVPDGCEIKWVYRDDENKECTDEDKFQK